MRSPIAEKRRRIDEIGDESRRRILDAAEALFGEKGFDKTSFADIAVRSGISRGSIPWHFENKNGLLVAVYERAVKRFLDGQDPGAARGLSIGEIIERTARWLDQPAAAMIYKTFAAALTPGDPIHGHFSGFHRDTRRRLAAAVRASASGRIVPIDPMQVAAVINGAFIGLHLQRQIDPTFDMAAAMHALVLMVESTLGAGAEAEPRGRNRATHAAKRGRSD